VQTYYASYSGKNAETRDLQKVFENVSGKNLDQFFRQWLYTPGIPRLDMKWKYNASQQQLEVNIRQTQKFVYEFPLEILIQNSSGKNQNETIQVNKTEQDFIISVSEKPSLVKADPNVNLLFEGNFSETK
jgi:aminopeptidase N